MAYGVIYIAHNARDGSDVFKVGKTERLAQQRMRELTSATAVLGNYSALAEFVVADVDAAEQACHKALRDHRIQDNREFFQLSFEALLRIVQHAVGPFAARDSAPSISRDASGLAIDLVTASASALEAKGLETFDAIETMIMWIERLEGTIFALAEDMRSEEGVLFSFTIDSAYERARDLLAYKGAGKDWGKRDGRNFYQLPTPRFDLVSVLFCAPQVQAPLELWVTANSHDLPDAHSAASEFNSGEYIVEPAVLRNPEGREGIVRWKMLDDGRFGRVTMSVHVDENVLTGARWKRCRPSAIVRIVTEELKYNDDLEAFGGAKVVEDFTDLEAATSQFRSLVEDNYRHASNDIRVVINEQADPSGGGHHRVSDRGAFQFRLVKSS